MAKTPKTLRNIIRALRQAVRDETVLELDATGDMYKDKISISSNILWILRDRGIMPKGGTVVIPEGGYDYGITEDEGEFRFAGSFEIFSDPDTIIAYGSVTAMGDVFDSGVELRDMMVNITQVVGYPESQGPLRFF